MNDDKLKKRIEKLKIDADELLAEPQVMDATDGVFAQTKEWAISVTDLITAYEQSQADAEHYKKLAINYMSKKVAAKLKLTIG